MLGSLASLVAKLRMRQLALVVAIADHRSLREAADVVHVSQPAATKMLREVEASLGTAVFERARGGMRSTPAGEVVLRYARITLADLRRLHEELAEIDSGGSGHVSIGSVLAPEPLQIARAIARFKAARPAVTVSLQIGTSDALIPRLLSAELDAVIGRQTAAADTRRLAFEALAQERLALVAGPDSPMAARRWTAAQLHELAWVLLPPGTPVRRALEDAFRRRKVSPPASVVETNSMFTVVSLLQNSQMVSAISERAAAHFAAKGELAVLESNLHFEIEPYGVLRRKGRPVTPATEALLAIIGEELGAHGGAAGAGPDPSPPARRSRTRGLPARAEPRGRRRAP
ncbi:LysR family transcriptional regulator [Ramlibacter sp. AN1015]|uniref:LysR family transcriptional regulator n=1 Tax=Ramlibacter sp. AN1015 TaxID=3133428 RepID=UPI0030C3B58E